MQVPEFWLQEVPTKDIVVLVQLSFTNFLVEAVPWSEINVGHEPGLVQLFLNLRTWKNGGGDEERKGGKKGGRREEGGRKTQHVNSMHIIQMHM